MAAESVDFEFTYEDLRKVKSARKPISKWYTATEVGTHNNVTDCWVTISGRVYDLTKLFDGNPPLLCEPLLFSAGLDISHWFEPRTFDMDAKEIDTAVLIWFHPTFRINQYFTPQVPSEETINEILYRYTEHNKHAVSYEWKAILEYDTMKFITLDMNKTLTENGVKDESEDFGCAGMELDYLLPVLHLHYTDDLTEA